MMDRRVAWNKQVRAQQLLAEGTPMLRPAKVAPAPEPVEESVELNESLEELQGLVKDLDKWFNGPYQDLVALLNRVHGRVTQQSDTVPPKMLATLKQFLSHGVKAGQALQPVRSTVHELVTKHS